jgi:phosphopantothenoylcysteine decarboxylase/phosphopantothenate--cysteine ligase
MKVVLGVSGGIAAYKAALLLRLFTEDGHDVTVVPTAAALEFVGAPTWAALSGKPVATDVWSAVHEVPHVRLGKGADLVVVAPATADLLARAAHGLADDLLTNTLLTARCPVVLAPAMHTEMWQHPATVANVETLRSRGVHVVDPASGRLTGADTGPGRLPEPEEIYAVCRELTSGAPARSSGGSPGEGDAVEGALAGRRVVVSAGGTREPLDPVRFLGNRSSGKQGLALAAVAAARGAEVTLVAANVALPAAPGVKVVSVETALELQDAMTSIASDADVVVMSAAVADFRPKHYADAKIKKSHADSAAPGAEADESAPTIELVRNPDILAGLVRSRGEGTTPVIVGFAAETGDAHGSVMDHGRDKLARKGCDVLVVNEVGTDLAFGRDDNLVHILRQGDDRVVEAGPAPKEAISATVWDVIQDLLTDS